MNKTEIVFDLKIRFKEHITCFHFLCCQVPYSFLFLFIVNCFLQNVYSQGEVTTADEMLQCKLMSAAYDL